MSPLRFCIFSIFIIILNISIIFCEIKKSNYNDFLKKLENYEIVYPKVLNKSEVLHRLRRSSPAASEPPEMEKINLNVLFISLNNLTIEASKNDDVLVPKSFESHWIQSGHRKMSIEDGLRLQKCLAVQGNVNEVPGSSVVLTICKNEIFGLLTLGGVPHFIQPINDNQHVLYETKIPEKLRMMMKSGEINLDDNEIHKSSADENDDKTFDIESDGLQLRSVEPSLCSDTGNSHQLVRGNETLEYSRYQSSKRCRNRRKRALTICDTKEKLKLTRDLAGRDYLDLIDPSMYVPSRDVPEHKNPFIGQKPLSYRSFSRAMRPANVRTAYNRRPRHISSRWIKMIVGVDYDVIDFHGDRTHQYVYTILNIVSTLFKQISRSISLKIVVLKLFMYPDPSDSAINTGDTRYPLYSVNRWNRLLWQEAKEKHDMGLWLTQYELRDDVKTVPGAFMCQYQWHCILIEDAGWLSAVKIAHAIGHLIGLTHDGDLNYNNNCASESLLRTTIMAPEIPTVIPIPVWSTCSMQDFHVNILKYHCLERPPVHFENSAFMSGVFSLDEQCRIEFGDGWIFCSRILVPDPCKELWCNRAAGSRRSCMTRQTPTLEGTACGRGKRCINHTCEDAKRPSVETTTVTQLPQESTTPEIPSSEPSTTTESPRPIPPTLPSIITPHPALFNPPNYFDPNSMDQYTT